MSGAVVTAWAGLFFGITGLGAVYAVMTKFIRDASGGLR